ncbi:hypothetical protein [Pontibacter sp. G13]|uniref:hypothetical protein n=1 Tax=Pontibacter sp. G13 TaxID=3074898 RepID=UPI00288BECDE|nr:hypothetical protein [Pontibacter sp. G13]WNJ20229.1 hypothetical protein RJD25_07090 [Pontibacter sp. G13]
MSLQRESQVGRPQGRMNFFRITHHVILNGHSLGLKRWRPIQDLCSHSSQDSE